MSTATKTASATPTKPVKMFYLRSPRHTAIGVKACQTNDCEPTYLASERVITVARRMSRQGKKVHYQVAVCRPETRYVMGGQIAEEGDTFSKALGRAIATGRLDSKPFRVTLPTSENLETSGPLVAVLCHAAGNEAIPHSARREIVRYLKGRGISDPSAIFSGLEVSVETPGHLAPPPAPVALPVSAKKLSSKKTANSVTADNIRQAWSDAVELVTPAAPSSPVDRDAVSLFSDTDGTKFH